MGLFTNLKSQRLKFAAVVVSRVVLLCESDLELSGFSFFHHFSGLL